MVQACQSVLAGIGARSGDIAKSACLAGLQPWSRYQERGVKIAVNHVALVQVTEDYNPESSQST